MAQLLQETPPLRSWGDGTAVGRSGSSQELARPRARRGRLREPVHVLQIFQPEIGGVPAYVVALAAGLIGEGIRVSVACTERADGVGALRELGIEVLPLELTHAPHPVKDALAVRALARFCRERDVTVIHGHSTKAGMVAALTGARAGLPSLYTPNGWSFQQLVPVPLRLAYALFERHLVRRYHAGVIAESLAGRELAERWRVAPRGRVQVVRTGLPPASAPSRMAARSELGLSGSEILAVWVGRAGAQKRPQDLVAVARRLRGSVRVLAVCHGAHGTPLELQLRSSGVLLAPAATAPATAYAAADMMLQTSAWEATPLAVLEAMAAGLPVIAYDVGGVADQVQAGRTGYLVRARDTHMLSECALSLARRPELRERMGTAGRELAGERFSYSAMVQSMAGAYREYGVRHLEPGESRETAAEVAA